MKIYGIIVTSYEFLVSGFLKKTNKKSGKSC